VVTELQQPCCGELVVDVVLDAGQRGAQRRWGLGLAGGEERGQDTVVDLGAGDGEREPAGSEVVGVGVGRRVMSPLRASLARP
jgi:hypothetical protein